MDMFQWLHDIFLSDDQFVFWNNSSDHECADEEESSKGVLCWIDRC